MKKHTRTSPRRSQKGGSQGQKQKSSFGVTPLGDRVLIQEIEAQAGEEVRSGIIIPDTVNNDKGAKKGRVVAVGAGRYEDGKLLPVRVSPGDTVLFQWGDAITYKGGEYYVVSESNIIAVVG